MDVPGADGKAGMACIVSNEESVDVGGLVEKVYRALSTYAAPQFVHLTHQPDLTGDPQVPEDWSTQLLVHSGHHQEDWDNYLELQNGQIHL